ncbi:unnamed protein product [Calicophoron daubneyi]|uniref:Uncharacterized protein n=1 Tax=Calicophoron daubneyi TaxID=300641 RepID=A0AAV2T1Y7_CALDB
MTTDVQMSARPFRALDKFDASLSGPKVSASSVKRKVLPNSDLMHYFGDVNKCKRRRANPSCGPDTSENHIISEVKEPLKKIPALNGVSTRIEDYLSAAGVNELCQNSISSECGRVISVKETYQLGYFGAAHQPEDYSDLFIFDFVDGLEVSYPISITAPDALPIDLPPLFMESEYMGELTALANGALDQLTERLNKWFDACKQADEDLLIWRHVTAYEEAVALRKQIFELIFDLVPQSELSDQVDFSSPSADRLIARIISALNGVDAFGRFPDKRDSECSPADAVPVVSLCPEPNHCLEVLRAQILTLLRMLLPQLNLPHCFDPEQDLRTLLDAAHTLNKR